MVSIYEKLIRPLAFAIDPETAHELGLSALRYGLASKAVRRLAARKCAGALEPVERFGLRFPNPIGVAAGFDKNGVAVDQLAALGFGFVEVGTVTFRPQKGNEKPRVFRLPIDKALINRLGFNNDGAAAVADRLKNVERMCVVGVNIGKNKDVPNEEAVGNYLRSFDIVHPVADYIAINVSSPNTPNLRELQKGDSLDELLAGIQERNLELGRKPLLVKIAPDLAEAEIESVVGSCIRHEVNGIIATNTTVSREGLKDPSIERLGSGGLSGKPLFAKSNEVISKIYACSKGKLPIIGVGGIFTPDDAFEKVAAGASLLQVYTGFVYRGPSCASILDRGLAAILKERGFRSLDEAVGSGSK
jgi:dihydroorotate dehydrogenase